MKKLLILPLVLAASSFPVRATNISVIDFSGTISNPVTFENGASMPNGSGLIRIGYFNTAAQSATWLNDLQSCDPAKVNSALQSFIPLGENAVTPNLGAIPVAGSGPRFAQRTINGVSQSGRLAGQILTVNPVVAPPNTVNSGGVPQGSRIFMLVYSDSGGNVAAGFGVFSADIWLMPSDGGLNLQLNTTDVDTATEVFLGTFGSLKLRTLCPEPGTCLTLTLAGFGMVLRRRR